MATVPAMSCLVPLRGRILGAHIEMYLGLDISSKTIHGVVLNAKGEVNRTFKCESTLKDMDLRLIDLGNQFEKVSLKGIKLAVVENGVYVQNIKATNGIVQVIGMVKFLCSKQCDVMGIDNRSWKKDTVGAGNADKSRIAEFAKIRWGEQALPNEQDYFDSACIALWGHMRWKK